MTKHIPEIIYEDSNVVVFNKPSGMIMNKADTSRHEFTLQDYIETLGFVKSSDTELFKRGGIVHRLDKETSGVVVVAKNEESFLFLQAQFKNRTTEKEYLALVHGKLVEEGEISVPIGRLPWNRMRFGVIPSGRDAFTKFKVLKYYKSPKKKGEILSYVRVFPKTGRTHQIRVHFQYVGHPIFADSLYAGRKNIQADRKQLNRHFLHAEKLTINLPKIGLRTLNAPLPLDLENFLSTLK